MNRTKIDWPGHPSNGVFLTLNPVVGCKRGCEYCYARKAHQMRHEAFSNCKQMPGCYAFKFTEIMFYPQRLVKLSKRKKPARVFLNSVSDPEYWSSWALLLVLKAVELNPNIEGMLLTKGFDLWKAYSEKFVIPTNMILGITITGTEPEEFDSWDHPRNFISFEPMLGPWPAYIDHTMFELVIVGALADGAVPPKNEWIQSVRDNVPEKKIYWKKSMDQYLCRK